MNPYQNQYRRMSGKGDCRMPVTQEEKACCRMPEVTEEKRCFQKSEPRMGKDGCCNTENSWPIGMTYVPMQQWRELYSPDEGFHKGTIFKELDLPFLGRGMC